MLIAYFANLPYEYNFLIRLFKKGNPIENRPITEYIGMRDAAFNMSVLGMTDKIDMETQEEKDKRAGAVFNKLPDGIKSRYKVKDV